MEARPSLSSLDVTRSRSGRTVIRRPSTNGHLRSTPNGTDWSIVSFAGRHGDGMSYFHFVD